MKIFKIADLIVALGTASERLDRLFDLTSGAKVTAPRGYDVDSWCDGYETAMGEVQSVLDGNKPQTRGSRR